jgi:hypothetical protein
VAEDWRVTVSVPREGGAGRLKVALHEHEVEDDVRQRLDGRVAVSSGDDHAHVFLYADTSATASEAKCVVEAVLDAHGLHADTWAKRLKTELPNGASIRQTPRISNHAPATPAQTSTSLRARPLRQLGCLCFARSMRASVQGREVLDDGLKPTLLQGKVRF